MPENTLHARDLLTAEIRRDKWPMPEVFKWLQEIGMLENDEMARTFNCGIGMVVVVAGQDASAARQLLESQGETAYEIGSIRKREGNEHQTRIV